MNTCAVAMLTIVRLKKPVIEQVDGAAIAADCQLVASCDLTCASNNAASFPTLGVLCSIFTVIPWCALLDFYGHPRSLCAQKTHDEFDVGRERDVSEGGRTDRIDQSCDEHEGKK